MQDRNPATAAKQVDAKFRDPPGFRLRRVRNWFFLGLTYASYYLCRYNLGIVAPELKETLGFSNARYGARIYAGTDLDLDGRDDLVAGYGPDPSVGSEVKVFRYNGADVVEWFSLQAFTSPYTHGTSVAAGLFSPP